MSLQGYIGLAKKSIAALAALLIFPGWAAAAPLGDRPITFPYKVSSGDYLWYLAQRYQTSVKAIKAANNLTSDMIYPGQILMIPANQPDFPGTGGFLYEVSPGDQLWYLARAYGTTVEAIMAANHLVSDQIFAGQTLIIPQTAPAQQQQESANAATAAAPAQNPLDNLVFPFAPDVKVWWQDDWGAGREWVNGQPTAVHEGNDLFAPMGTPIRAVADGVVTRYGWNYYGGWRLTVLSDSGYSFYYAHMSGYAPGIAEGVKIKAGQIIGYVGNTGNGPVGTSGLFEPHLHFGIYDWNFQPLNPYPYLKSAEMRNR